MIALIIMIIAKGNKRISFKLMDDIIREKYRLYVLRDRVIVPDEVFQPPTPVYWLNGSK